MLDDPTAAAAPNPASRVCIAALLALVILLVLWETVLAPLRPAARGSR